jgi:demethylmenaquinone methyltransferase/2-methoxy-6-polyprenyl-1,4-benzoquinol methylase
MSGPGTDRSRFARELFAGLAPEYERMGAVWSFGQDPRWRRFLVSRVGAMPGSWVLDVATGTGLVARALARRNLRVVGLDQSPSMIRRGFASTEAQGLADRVRFVGGAAERLPFADETFDAVTFTYLLRYVADPPATLAELARVLRPGGVMAGLEFHVPEKAWAHGPWLVYTRALMPAIGWTVSPAWHRTGRFLGRDVTAFYRRFPLPVQIRWWQDAGLRRVRTRLFSNGAAVVTWAVKRNRLVDD